VVDRQQHWDTTYASKPETGVSWFQSDPALSFRWIKEAAPDHSANIIDIGGGASRLADRLITEGYSNLTVLDISSVALSRTRERIGCTTDKVNWITADVTAWTPDQTWDVWHDRAVFHFLTESSAQDAYIAALRSGTKEGSAVIMATFAPTGPEKCSGLPVQRYNAQSLAARLGPYFHLYAEAAERHPTPFGTTQDFIYAAFRRR
jgi:ubiquinone/menaquinone biosynthesis C-methylase UbiE